MPWSAEDDALLRAQYGLGGIKAAQAAFLGRTACTLYKRAAALGVQRKRRWTADDDARLRAQWSLESIRTIARGLRRTVITVYYRAGVLGLQRGAPEGWEYLSVAAARCGYAAGQLARICKWAGVRVMPAQSRQAPGASRRFHIIERGEAEDAVQLWLATETVEAAARRHGMGGETLARWLRAAGVKLARVAAQKGRSKKSSKLHRRVESAVVDRVIAEHRAAAWESLDAAARRVGVSASTLGKWLREAGLVPRGLRWRLDAHDVDRVVADNRKRVTCRARAA